ncbi:MAG: hypothetical protein E7282_01015 [Lachnospiraceae bacterium]|nr:hypothetical protein [Lachnospiraceae bacterium]
MNKQDIMYDAETVINFYSQNDIEYELKRRIEFQKNPNGSLYNVSITALRKALELLSINNNHQ